MQCDCTNLPVSAQQQTKNFFCFSFECGARSIDAICHVSHNSSHLCKQQSVYAGSTGEDDERKAHGDGHDKSDFHGLTEYCWSEVHKYVARYLIITESHVAKEPHLKIHRVPCVSHHHDESSVHEKAPNCDEVLTIKYTVTHKLMAFLQMLFILLMEGSGKASYMTNN